MALAKSKTKKLDKQATMGGGPGDQISDLITRGNINANMPVDEYSEKPRPTLFSVLKKLKEGAGGSIINRVCYVGRLNE